MKQTNKIITGFISLLLLVSCQTSIDDEAIQGNDYQDQEVVNSSNENTVDSKNIQEIIEQFGEPLQKVEILKNSESPNYIGARKIDKILPYEQAIVINDQRILLYISDRWAIFDENLDLIKELNVTVKKSHPSGKYFFYIDESGHYGTMSDDGEILIPADDKYQYIYNILIDNYNFTFFEDLDDQTYLISKDGSSVKLVDLEVLESLIDKETQFERRYSDDLVALYNSTDDKFVTDYIYDDINIGYYNLDNGTSYHIVELDGLKGVIDSTGETLLDLKYEDIIDRSGNGQVIVKEPSTGEHSIYDLNKKKFIVENIPSEYNNIQVHEIMGPPNKIDVLIADYLYSFASWLTEETLVYDPAGELVYTAPSAISVTNMGHVYYKNPKQTMLNKDHVQYTVLDENYEVVFKSMVFDDILQFENGVYAFFDEYLNSITPVTKDGLKPLMNDVIFNYDIQFFGDYLLTDGKIYHFYTSDTVDDVYKD